jgi:tetratricopeptide (TPR) repeat protein
MERIKGCYVSMPFGRKTDPASGLTVDYDQIYNVVIRPAVEHAGLMATRGDEFLGGVLVAKSIYSAVIASDLMIAEISAGNPNVMYELGIRHATSPRPTILLASNQSRLAFHLLHMRQLRYDLDAGGTLGGAAAESFRSQLVKAIETSLGAPISFSPIFELFPEMQPNVPAGLMAPGLSASPSDPLLGRQTRHSNVQAAEAEVVKKSDADPTAMLAILKGYQEVSAWDDLVRFADTLPQEVRALPEIVQTMALALNRRADPGDRERAEELITQLLERTGGDGESYGILGRIYKDRYRETGNEDFWRKAYDAYRKGFESQPENYYPGLNAITMLVERGTPEARREIKLLLPRVKGALESRTSSKPPDFWDLAACTHLAAVGHDWAGARRFADQMLKSSPSSWMLVSSVNDLKVLGKMMPQSERGKLDRLTNRLEERVKSGAA